MQGHIIDWLKRPAQTQTCRLLTSTNLSVIPPSFLRPEEPLAEKGETKKKKRDKVPPLHTHGERSGCLCACAYVCMRICIYTPITITIVFIIAITITAITIICIGNSASTSLSLSTRFYAFLRPPQKTFQASGDSTLVSGKIADTRSCEYGWATLCFHMLVMHTYA